MDSATGDLGNTSEGIAECICCLYGPWNRHLMNVDTPLSGEVSVAWAAQIKDINLGAQNNV